MPTEKKLAYPNSKKNPGIITFELPKGLYLVEVKFVNTKIVALSKFISFISALLLLFIVIMRRKLRFLPKF